MPWRTQTLTPFRSSGSNSENVSCQSVCSVDDLHSLESNPQTEAAVEDLNALFGTDELDFDLALMPGDGDLDEQQPEDQKSSALDLGATLVPREPTLSDDQFSMLLAHSFINTRKRPSLLMPWEKGVAKKIFCRDKAVPKPESQETVGWVRLDGAAFLHSEEVVDVAAGHDMEMPCHYFEKAISAISDKSFEEQRCEQLNDAVEKWLCILLLRPEASDTGKLIEQSLDLDSDKSEARKTVSVVLGVRSKSTAVSRANAILKFLRWRETSLHKRESLPVTEEDAWLYLGSLQELGAAPTRANSFLSACNYARYIFGFNSWDAICTSRRLRGLADVLYIAKKPLSQAKVLTVNQVRWLHQMLTSESTHPVDRSFVGYILTALYGRCRHSDLAMVETIDCDFDCQGGFIEVSTKTHKTSRHASQKTVLLPIVIPAIGVEGGEWITAAQQAFEAVGLCMRGAVKGPLYRPPSLHGWGAASRRGITSSEVTRFLRACFEEGDVEEGPRVSSHSLKATTLSWTAKACVGPADQAILGRHSSAYAETSAVYSRDASIRAVSQLQAVIDAIRSGEFLPDCPRSHYKPRVDAEASADGPVKEEDGQWSLVGKSEPTIDLECETIHLLSSDDDSDDSLETSDSEAEGLPVPRCTRHVLSEATSKLFVKHKVSKLVHFKSAEVGANCIVLSCGRSLNGNYEAVDNFDTVDMCKRCREMSRKEGILQQP
eukprot:s4862_g1.t1